jgi:hypothetical protein
VLRVQPDLMTRLPKCASCGAADYRVDGWMNRRDTRAMSCDCAGYVHLTGRIFPHRRGSPYCWFRKNGTQRQPGDDDFKDARLERATAEELNLIFNTEREIA